MYKTDFLVIHFTILTAHAHLCTGRYDTIELILYRNVKTSKSVVDINNKKGPGAARGDMG